MKITSVTLTTPISGLPNPIGLAAPGKILGTKLQFGYQYTARPATISFWYKYTPAANDSAQFLAVLWNGSTTPHDTVAFGFWHEGATVSGWTQQIVTLVYNPAFSTIMPDSIALTFSSTRLFNSNYKFCTNCGTAGSNLWVDDIGFGGWNGVSETEMSKGVSVFPNPSSDFATITVEDLNEASLVEVFDITGRSITTIPLSEAANGLNKKSAAITTHGMAAGLYSLSVYDKNKHILRNGKLNVVK